MRVEVPTVEVRYRNIKVNVKDNTVSLEVSTRKVGGKKWLSKNTTTVNAKLDFRVKAWLMKFHADGKTSFQKFLEKKEIEFKPGVLSQLEFTSHNLSESFYDNPFRLVQFDDGGYQLCLTHMRNKPEVHEGKTYKYYSNKCFRRLVILTRF